MSKKGLTWHFDRRFPLTTLRAPVVLLVWQLVVSQMVRCSALTARGTLAGVLLCRRGYISWFRHDLTGLGRLSSTSRSMLIALEYRWIIVEASAPEFAAFSRHIR